MFFFEKKNQKTFGHWRARQTVSLCPMNKSLLLFFKKEVFL